MDNKKKIIAIVVAIVVIIAIAIAVGVSANGKKANDSKTTTQSTTQSTTKAQTTTTTTTTKSNNEVVTEIIEENGTTRVVHYPNGKPSGNTPAPKPNKPQPTKPSGGNGGNKPQPKPDNKPIPNPDTNAKPDTMPTQPGAKPLNAQEKQWVIDNYFMEFKNHGALPNFFVKDNGSKNGLTRKTILNNKNYQDRINAYKNDYLPGSRPLIKGEAENCKYVRYWFTEENGQTVLYYKPVKG